MEAYEVREPDMAKETRASMLRHMWYLAEETVVLALFNPSVGEDDKVEMSQVLLTQPRPEACSPGRPSFPQESLLCDAQTLSPFIGPPPWVMFGLLGGSGRWLHHQPRQWPEDEENARMEKVVMQLAVVNDAAERGIKDCTDYADAARDGSLHGRIITVVSAHRVGVPSMLKHELEKA